MTLTFSHRAWFGASCGGVSRARPARLPARSRRSEAASVRLSSSVAQRRPPPRYTPKSGRSRLSTPPMYRRPVSFGAFPVYQVVLWAVAVGGAAQVISGAARLGSADGSAARLGGSALLRRLGSSAALLLLVLPRRFFVVSLSCGYVIRAHAHATRRGITRGAVTIETVTAIAEPAETGESSDVRRSGGAARCSAVTRGGGGCGMAAAAERGGRAAVVAK